MNRREFFKGVTAAVIVASAGLALTAGQRRFVANYIQQYSLMDDSWVHRFSVRVGNDVHFVDGKSADRVLKEHEVKTMLEALERHIGGDVSISGVG